MRMRAACLGAAVAAAVVLPACQSSGKAPAPAAAPAPAGEFASLTIDLGVIASDVERSAKFYTEVAGFTEIQGFDASAAMTRDAGLADGKSDVHVRVFTLGEGPGATRLKLLQFKASPGAAPDNTYIHSTLGFRYLTIRVKDQGAVLARLAKAGVKVLGKGPVALPGGAFLTCVKDPDGNLVEFVGPRTN
jgi:catechol 2,3-dioxygenase-like lactoylglutathione lyase family enzyme